MNPPRIKHGTRNLRLVEQELPEVEIYVGTKLTVISDTQVIVRCVAAMEPAPAIQWKIQGKDSGFNDDVTLSKDNSTLTISEPGVEDSGEYTCTASNNVGRDSKSSNINILRKLYKSISLVYFIHQFQRYLSLSNTVVQWEINLKREDLDKYQP